MSVSIIELNLNTEIIGLELPFFIPFALLILAAIGGLLVLLLESIQTPPSELSSDDTTLIEDEVDYASFVPGAEVAVKNNTYQGKILSVDNIENYCIIQSKSSKLVFKFEDLKLASN